MENKELKKAAKKVAVAYIISTAVTIICVAMLILAANEVIPPVCTKIGLIAVVVNAVGFSAYVSRFKTR